jgi:hypothetical protein
MEESLKITGIIEIRLERNGKTIVEKTIHNLITSAGKAAVAGLVGNVGGISSFTYLALGTGTTPAAIGDTALESEVIDSGLERVSATTTRQTTNVANDTLQLVYAWTASGSKNVSEIGAFNASSAGIMLGRQVFTAIPFQTSDVFTATYKFIFS